jgi:hypothetical protein
VQRAVNAACPKELGIVAKVKDYDKAAITLADFAKLKKVWEFEPVTTVSADEAWRHKLGNVNGTDWELKVYRSGDSLMAAVTTDTDSWEHRVDAAQWIAGTYLSLGVTPNGEYAERYLGQYFADKQALSDFDRLKRKGYLRGCTDTDATYTLVP